MFDPWPTYLVKELSDILLPSFTKLVNCSLVERFVPSSWKQEVVTPLIKKKLHCPRTNLKITVQYLAFVSYLSW